MTREWIENSSLEQVDKERAMTREEAIKHLEEWKECISSAYRRQVIDMAIEALQAEPKHGKWIEEKDGWYGGQGCRCSNCGYGYSYKAYHEPYEFDFCPNCGCAMTKEKEK